MLYENEEESSVLNRDFFEELMRMKEEENEEPESCNTIIINQKQTQNFHRTIEGKKNEFMS